MDTNPHAAKQTSGVLPDSRPSPPPSPAAPPIDHQQARLRRVDELEARGLTNPNPHAACLKSIQADLIRSAFHTGPALTAALANMQPSPEGARQAERLLNNHLRLTRQIDRLAQFELRSYEARKKADALANKLSELGGPLRKYDQEL